jgi:hypothetical protein
MTRQFYDNFSKVVKLNHVMLGLILKEFNASHIKKITNQSV